jgi:hypothetical protein
MDYHPTKEFHKPPLVMSQGLFVMLTLGTLNIPLNLQGWANCVGSLSPELLKNS